MIRAIGKSDLIGEDFFLKHPCQKLLGRSPSLLERLAYRKV